MSKIKTAGDLRGFLADVMIDIRAGSVEATDAHAIAKIAAQINQSLSTEINAALQLERMGKNGAVAGAMMIGSETFESPAITVDSAGGVWCEQCDARVSAREAAGCKSKYCSIRHAQVGTHPQGGDAKQAPGDSLSDAVTEGHAPTPSNPPIRSTKTAEDISEDQK